MRGTRAVRVVRAASSSCGVATESSRGTRTCRGGRAGCGALGAQDSATHRTSGQPGNRAVFGLTNSANVVYLRHMTHETATRIIQMCYPQVYVACHTRHLRRRTTAHRLSARDASILAHLSDTVGMAPSTLSRHLGVARSTISEALKRLVQLGYVRRSRAAPAVRPASAGASAARTRDVVLTAFGVQALQDTSVLEGARLHAALASLSFRDLQRVVTGMELLANACQAVAAHNPEDVS